MLYLASWSTLFGLIFSEVIALLKPHISLFRLETVLLSSLLAKYKYATILVMKLFDKIPKCATHLGLFHTREPSSTINRSISC